jgi:hypothetical protein
MDSQGQHVDVDYPGAYSTKIAHGWLDLSDARGGLTVVLRNAIQLDPKQLAFADDAIRVDLWPEQAGILSWHQGMARTHRILMHFHHGDGVAAEVNKVSSCYEQDLMLWTPEWFIGSGAFGEVLSHQPKRYPCVEATLRDQFTAWRRSSRATGLLDYGDSPMLEAGLREAQYMANNQVDRGHALAMQYARVGERAYYEDLEAAVWHLMDVDVIHHTTFDPVELGGARMQGPAHVQYNCEGLPSVSVAPSQMWTEGLLEYHFLSGHPRALEVAEGIGECLLRMLDRRWGLLPYPVSWHGSRDSGWPLLALSALYEATGDERWLAGARRIAESLLENQGADGAWGMWVGSGWYRGVCPLHLGITLTGLSRYHRLTGDERVRESIVRAADAMLDTCTFPDGAPIYITDPKYGYRWSHYFGTDIESLGYVWELTGDVRYLEAGRVTHRHNMGDRWLSAFSARAFAYTWRGNLRYMAWADKAGMLVDLPS